VKDDTWNESIKYLDYFGLFFIRLGHREHRKLEELAKHITSVLSGKVGVSRREVSIRKYSAGIPTVFGLRITSRIHLGTYREVIICGSVNTYDPPEITISIFT
jgi:hypothetical protein